MFYVKRLEYVFLWRWGGIFLFALTLRMIFFVLFTRYGTNAWLYVDSMQYHTIASQIATGNGIALQSGDPQYYRLPGYPLFLALCYVLFGYDPHDALIVQLVIASAIPCLIGAVSMALFPDHPMLALVSAVIAAIHPGFILYSSMLATESLTVVLLLIFFLLLFMRRLDQHVLLSSGVILGFISMIRPIGHYLLVMALFFLMLEKSVLHKKIKSLCSISVGWLIPVGWWLVRNFLLTGYLFFHSLPGIHFLQYGAVPVVMAQQRLSYQDARGRVLGEWRSIIEKQEKKTGHTLHEYEQCLVGERIARTYMLRHPLLLFQHCVTEIIKTCVGLYSAVILLGDGAVWPHYSGAVSWWTKIYRFLMPKVQRPFLRWFIYADIIMTVVVFLGVVLFGIMALFNRSLGSVALRTFPFIVLIIGLSCVYGGARLRMPVEPLMLICALYAWGALCIKKGDAA